MKSKSATVHLTPLNSTISNNQINELWNGFLNDLQERTSFSNWRPVQSRGANWILPFIGMLTTDDLTELHLQKIINAAFRAGLSRKYLSSIRADLIAFCKYCRKCKASTFQPEDIIIPKSAPVGSRTILQPCDLVTLFTTTQTTHRGDLIEDNLIFAYRFQVLTGLRPGELLGLCWDDIAGERVLLQRSINIYGEVTSGKNDNARRMFFLNKSSQAVLDEQRAVKLPGPFIFPRVNEPLYCKHLKRFCRAQNMPVISPYEARHTFVSILQCLPEGELRAIIGHSKNMDTFGVYAHAVNGQRMATANKIWQIFYDITDGAV